MTIFLSEEVQNMLFRLQASSHKEGNVHIPSELPSGSSSRIRNNESLHSWFQRVTKLLGGVESCIITDNMAWIGNVQWKDGKVSYTNIQVLTVKNGSIEDFYLDSNGDGFQSQYFRLEFDSQMPGPLFKEPLPHIHTVPDREPRFPLCLTSAKTMIIDFLEFLFLNYQYDVWKGWARRIWENYVKNKTYELDKIGIFDTLCEAYEQGKTEVILRRYKNELQRLKDILHKEKKAVSEIFASLPEVSSLLNYNS